MARFTFTATLALYGVEIEAETQEEALASPEQWISWIAPTAEQLEDFSEDHDNPPIDEGSLEMVAYAVQEEDSDADDA